MNRARTLTPPPETTNAPSESLIDRHSHFDGLYRTDHDLRIEGSAEGEIQCKGTVIITEAASVSAQVQARNVILAGSASGEITCQERITIQPTGVMQGTLQAASLKVEEGAFFEGEFRMSSASAVTDLFADWESGLAERRFEPKDTLTSLAEPLDEDEEDEGDEDQEDFPIEPDRETDEAL